MQNLVRNIFAYVSRRACYLLWPAWIVLFVEFLSRGNVGEAALWGLRHFPLFLINAVMVACLLLLLAAAMGRARIALGVVALLLLAPAAVSGIKLRLLGLPALPWDISLVSEADSVVHLRDVVSAGQAAGVLLFGAAGAGLAVKLGRERAGGRERLLAAVVSAAVLAATWLAPPALYGARALESDQALNVRTNGFLLAEAYNFKAFAGDHRQRDSNPEAVAAFAASPPPSAQPVRVDTGVKPNIIVVLSESLFDLTQLPGVSYSQDPLPFFHELQAKYPHGTMLSPMFGGGTANVELEVLTGLSMRFLPEGAIPYDQYLTHGVDSLASILSRQGYTATAITPWSNWFFHNNIVYRNLGFHRLITNEFMRLVFSGPNIPDAEVAGLIMAETARTDGPDFLFANTGENHYPYDPGKFETNSIRVQGLTEPAKGLLETYAQGCTAADAMLRTLVEHYQQSGEPTIIVWFGDHKPVLGPDYLVYRESGYISGTADPDFVSKMYEVPVLIWNNYLPVAPAEPLHISPSFLSPYVLDLAGRPGTAFTEYLKQLSKRLPVIPPERFWAAQQIPRSDLDLYSALEQDILFGDQKTYGDLKEQIVDPTYELGYGPIVIERVEVGAPLGNGDLPVTLYGRHFPPRAGVYVGGTKVATRWVDEGTATAVIPAGMARANSLEFELRLVDSQKNVIARSSLFTMPR